MTEDLDRQLTEMMESARRQAEQIQQVQREVGAASVTGQAGQGLITATVMGTGQITAITIDPDALRYYDAQALGPVVLTAVNDGVRRALTLARDRYAEVMPGSHLFDEVLARFEPPAVTKQPAAADTSMDYLSW
jgi:DNA-binding YbaB/EbfC family protein